MNARITQADRADLIGHDRVATFRKRARVVAIRMYGPFTVETDRGDMTGEAGDWLVTNHPDDDPESDLWSISDARMTATYEETL